MPKRTPATVYISRFIYQLDRGELFTTRHVLGFGETRGAVDQAIYRFVKEGRIRRVVRGVFIRNDPGVPDPPLETIAKVKMESFGRKLLTAPSNAARQLGMEEGQVDDTIYATDGRTTSFMYNGLRITAKGLAPRKLAFLDSNVGLSIRALWYVGKDRLSELLFSKAMHNYFRTDKEELRRNIGLLPSWISEFLTRKSIYWKDRPKPVTEPIRLTPVVRKSDIKALIGLDI